MDGYAVIAADIRRRVAIDARAVCACSIGFTRAQLPSVTVAARHVRGDRDRRAACRPGADAVVMVEETAKNGNDQIDVPRRRDRRPARRPAGRRHRSGRSRRRGRRRADAEPRRRARGDRPRRASTVFAKPRVAILSTGNEVVEPGQPLAPGQIFDVNRFTLGAIVVGARRDRRAAPAGAGHGRRARRRARSPARTRISIVFSGGSSVGERDLVVDAIAARGEMIFHGIAVRPGKPTAFALRRPARRFSACPAIRPRACRTPTSCSCRSCARVARLPPHAPRTVRVPLGRRIASVGRTAISSTRCACATASPTRRSRDRATSRACRRPTATSRFPPIRASVEEGTRRRRHALLRPRDRVIG